MVQSWQWPRQLSKLKLLLLITKVLFVHWLNSTLLALFASVITSCTIYGSGKCAATALNSNIQNGEKDDCHVCCNFSREWTEYLETLWGKSDREEYSNPTEETKINTLDKLWGKARWEIVRAILWGLSLFQLWLPLCIMSIFFFLKWPELLHQPELAV